MHIKIPPPLIALSAAALMFGIHMFIPLLRFNFDARKIFAIIIVFIGASIAISGMLEFRKAKTTVHPLNLTKSTTLVTGGLYQVTRNPMYLGLVVVLIGWGLALANGMTFLVIPLFILYMNQFQIKPEEAAMHQLFGDAFKNYKNKVRRWV